MEGITRSANCNNMRELRENFEGYRVMKLSLRIFVEIQFDEISHFQSLTIYGVLFELLDVWNNVSRSASRRSHCMYKQYVKDYSIFGANWVIEW